MNEFSALEKHTDELKIGGFWWVVVCFTKNAHYK